MHHLFWGTVTERFGEYMTEIIFKSNFFQHGNEFYLGDLFDEDGEEIEDAPSAEQLDEFAQTYNLFCTIGKLALLKCKIKHLNVIKSSTLIIMKILKNQVNLR